MEDRSKFEKGLKSLLNEHTVPLREEQWEKLAIGLAAQNKRKNRFWLFLGIVALITFASFSAGYYISNSQQKNIAAKASDEAQIINQNNLSNNLNNPNNQSQLKTETINNQTNSTEKNTTNTKNEKPLSKADIANYLKKQINTNNKTSNDLPFEKNSNNKSTQRFELGAIRNLTEKPSLDAKNFSNIENNQIFWINKNRFFPNKSTIGNISFSNQEIDDWPRIPKMRPRDPNYPFWKIVANSLSFELLAGPNMLNSAVQNNIDTFGNLLTLLAKQKTKPGAYNFGFQIQSSFYKNFTFGTGFNYSSISEKNNFEYIANKVPFFDSTGTNVIGYILYDDSLAPRVNINTNNNISNIQIPLQLGYEKMIAKKLKAGIRLGYSINVPLKYNVSYFNANQYAYQKLDAKDFKYGNYSTLGVNLKYNFYKPLWLGFNYQIQQSKNQINWDGIAIKSKDLQHLINLSLTYKL